MTKKNTKEKKIVIDQKKSLTFSSEEELYDHFSDEILNLEKELFQQRRDTDINEKDFVSYEENLNVLLEDPDEIWESKNSSTVSDFVATFIKRIDDEKGLYHIAIVYLTDTVPSFVYLHFPTKDKKLVEFYKRGELIFDEFINNAPVGSLEGDALLEGDKLALSCYEAMINLRSHEDILEENFLKYAPLREETIEDPDEVWRRTDSVGNVLVNFVKEFKHEKELHYIVVTVEDTPRNNHALLFSFPTKDKNLVGRYRLGENLQADEVVKESSH